MTEYAKTKIEDLVRAMTIEEKIITWNTLITDEPFLKVIENTIREEESIKIADNSENDMIVDIIERK